MAEEELIRLKLKSIDMDKNNKRSYKFKSRGRRNQVNGNVFYSQSTLFPIDTKVRIQSGKFPLTDGTDVGETYIIGNKRVILAGFTRQCTDNPPVIGECEILVEPAPGPIAGGKRRRKTKKAHRRRRSSRKRTTR
jgi:hypothetical protein